MDATASQELPENNAEWALRQVVGAVAEEGRLFPLVGDQELVVGREHPAFAHYPALSRRHAAFGVASSDRGNSAVKTPFLRDLGSRHGSEQNGSRVADATLVAGDFVRLGPCGFVVVSGSELAENRDDLQENGPVFGWSVAAHRLHAELLAASRSSRPISIVGEAGSGKSHFASALVARIGGARTLFVDAAIDDLSPLMAALTDGTRLVILDRVDETPVAQVATLVRFFRAVDLAPEREIRVISLRTGETLAPELLAWLSGWVVPIPPLRERREDLIPLVRACLVGLGAPEMRLEPALVERLFRERWPGNVRALYTQIEHLFFCADDALLLVDSPSSSLRNPLENGGVAAAAVLEDGSAIVTAAGVRVGLGGRKILRTILAALVEAHKQEASLSAVAVASVGWPGEKMLPRAAANRVYVAITSLRKLGLGAAIEHVDGGYRLARSLRRISP